MILKGTLLLLLVLNIKFKLLNVFFGTEHLLKQLSVWDSY